MIVIGCDPSLTDFGWAVLDMSKEGQDRLIDSGRIKTDSDEFFVIRYRRLREGIRNIIETYEPDYVGLEKPPHNASWSAGLYPIWISISEICYENRIPFAAVLPTQVKAYARGILGDSGKMFKSDMVYCAKNLLETKSNINHNIADAIITAWMAWRLKCLIDGQIEEEDLSEKEQYLLTRTIKRRKTGRIDKVGLFYKEGDAYYNLSDPKYDVLYEDKQTRMQRLDYSDIHGVTRNALKKAGFEKAPELLEEVSDADSDTEAIKILKKIDGVGDKGAQSALDWAQRVTD